MSFEKTQYEAGSVVGSPIMQRGLDEPQGDGGLPAGGTTGQVLRKNSGADGDAGWASSGAITRQYISGSRSTTDSSNHTPTWSDGTAAIVIAGDMDASFVGPCLSGMGAAGAFTALLDGLFIVELIGSGFLSTSDATQLNIHLLGPAGNGLAAFKEYGDPLNGPTWAQGTVTVPLLVGQTIKVEGNAVDLVTGSFTFNFSVRVTCIAL